MMIAETTEARGFSMADTYVWTGKGDGIYWFTPGNWFDVTTSSTATSAPGAGATVDFNASASDVSGGANVAAVNIAPGAQVSLGTLPGGATYTFGTLAVGNAATLTLLGGTSMAVGTAELGPSAGLDISRAWYLGVSTHDLNAAADAATTPGTGAYPGPVGATIDKLTMQQGAAVTLGRQQSRRRRAERRQQRHRQPVQPARRIHRHRPAGRADAQRRAGRHPADADPRYLDRHRHHQRRLFRRRHAHRDRRGRGARSSRCARAIAC